jgi:hypothetical protein
MNALDSPSIRSYLPALFTDQNSQDRPAPRGTGCAAWLLSGEGEMTTQLRLAGCAALLTILVGRGLAQMPPTAPPEASAVKPVYVHGTSCKLPVTLGDADRAQVQAIQLYVKQGQGDWQLKATAPASQKFFLYQPPQDGEYAFTVATVDLAGHINPPDVRQQPPMLVLIVDRQKPQIEAQRTNGPDGQPLLRCTINDANPDYASLQASYRAPDGQWHPLDPLPGARGVFHLPGSSIFSGMVRIRAADLAKNETTQEINLKEESTTQAAGTSPRGPGEKIAKTGAGMTIEPAGPVLQPEPPPGPGSSKTLVTDSKPAVPVLPSDIEHSSLPMPPSAGSGAIERTSFTGPANAGSPPRQILNTTRAALEYRLDQVGPSGVSKVEVYITSDGGKTWQRLCEDPDRRSPADLTLPGEGLYGVRLAVTNGNGFGGAPPAPGDQPLCWIEVDMTKPHAQLHEVDPVVHDGALEIHWTAADKNLGPEPVSLYYAAKKEGPWLPIARGLRNDGVYRWSFPRDVGGHFFLRLEVVDRAGNLARCDSDSPVVLDMTEPRAMVVGITGVTARP